MTQLRALHQSPTLLVPEKVLLPEGAQSGHAVFVEDGRIRAVGPLAAVAATAEKQPVQPAVPARNSEPSSDTRPAPARIDLPGRLLPPGSAHSHHHLTHAFGTSLVFGEPSEIFSRLRVPM